jgi:DNA-binding beta-propeller fold protein YncE
MRNLNAVALFLLILVTACTPGTPSTAIPTSPPEMAETTPSAVPTGTAFPTQTLTLPPPTATVAPTVTALPTATPTPMPVVFDHSGYKQFAVLRSIFPGYQAYLDGEGSTEIWYALSPSGDRIAISGCRGSMDNYLNCQAEDSGLLVVLDADTGELVADVPFGTGWPGGVAFTPDGESLLYGTTEQKVALWHLSTGTPGMTLFTQAATGRVSYPVVAVAPDGSSYAAVVERVLRVWDSTGGLLLELPARQARLSYSLNGSRLVVISADQTGVELYDTSTWTLARRFSLERIIDAAISPDGQVLVGIEAINNIAVVWDVASGERLAELDPDHWVAQIRFNPAGDLLIIAGLGNLDTRDSYSSIGTVYETQTWSRLDGLHSFSSDGPVEFTLDGSRMVVFAGAISTIWGMPDAVLQAGFETVQQFQAALHAGDYVAAAALFAIDEREVDYLAEMGVDTGDLAGSFERLCASQTIYCYPVEELVMMGYNWDDLTYLVRLTGPDGAAFNTPRGAQIIYFYLTPGADGKPRLIYLPQE